MQAEAKPEVAIAGEAPNAVHVPESLACVLQAKAEAEAEDAETAVDGGQEATAGSTGAMEQQRDGTGNGAGQAAQGELPADTVSAAHCG